MATAHTHTNQPAGIVHAGITRPAASTVILAGTKVITPEVTRLRVEWARLMDSGQTEEADALANEIRCADTFELAIANGLAELTLIERRALERRRSQTAERLRQARLADKVTPEPTRQVKPAQAKRYAPVSHQGKTARNRHKAAARRGRQLERAAQHTKGATSGKK